MDSLKRPHSTDDLHKAELKRRCERLFQSLRVCIPSDNTKPIEPENFSQLDRALSDLLKPLPDDLDPSERAALDNQQQYWGTLAGLLKNQDQLANVSQVDRASSHSLNPIPDELDPSEIAAIQNHEKYWGTVANLLTDQSQRSRRSLLDAIVKNESIKQKSDPQSRNSAPPPLPPRVYSLKTTSQAFKPEHIDLLQKAIAKLHC